MVNIVKNNISVYIYRSRGKENNNNKKMDTCSDQRIYMCILKMTIDFNGSMNAPFLILYACMSAYLCVSMCIHSCKQICAKGNKKKKKAKALYFEKGSTSV